MFSIYMKTSAEAIFRRGNLNLGWSLYGCFWSLGSPFRGLTVGLEKAVLPVPPTKTKVPTTFTGAMNSEYSEEWLNAMKLDLESIKGN